MNVSSPVRSAGEKQSGDTASRADGFNAKSAVRLPFRSLTVMKKLTEKKLLSPHGTAALRRGMVKMPERLIDADAMEKHIMESKVFTQYFKELVQALIWGEHTVDAVRVVHGRWYTADEDGCRWKEK